MSANNRIRKHRCEGEKVKRKPLKSKGKISLKDGRLLPIYDAELLEDLRPLFKQARKDYEAKKYGDDKSDYLFFRNIDKTTTVVRYQEIMAKLNIRYRPPHCLRHTKVTELMRLTYDKEYTKAWTGHTDERVFEKYNHLAEEIHQAIKNQDNDFDDLV